MIFPIPKVQEYGKSRIISKKISVALPPEDKLAISALRLFLPELEIGVGDRESATVIAKKKCNLQKEGYILKSLGGSAEIEYSDYSGLVHAMASLSELFTSSEDGGICLTEAEIKDYPEASHRGVMLDVARGVMPMPRLISDIVLIAKAKMNVLHLHLADSKGVAVELKSLPESYRLQGSYTAEDIEKIKEICEILALDIIPEFDMPAHSTMLLKLFPEMRCDVDVENPSLWTVCAASEEAYALYEKIIAELSAMFPRAKYFHIGGDEIEFLDLADKEKSPRICHWNECRRCRSKMMREGLSDRAELHYSFINRMNAVVKSHGKRTVMWSDQIDCNKPKGIDGDVLMHFWRIAGRGRGPHDGCSMKLQLDYGYEMINSYYPRTYVDMEEYMNAENLASWRWDEDPIVAENQKKQLIGGETCAWEYGNVDVYPHYARSLPSSIFLMGDKLWGGEKRSFTERDEILLTRAVFGLAAPRDFNIYSIFGSILPPRDDRRYYAERVRLDNSEREKLSSMLSSLHPRTESAKILKEEALLAINEQL